MQRRWLPSALAVTALAAGACDQAQDPVGLNDTDFLPAFAVTVPSISVGTAWVCSDGPTGDYTYDFTTTNATPASGSITVAAGACAQFATSTAAGATATIAPVSSSILSHPTGSEKFDHPAPPDNAVPVSQGVTTATQVTLTPIGNDHGWLVVFFHEADPPPPPPSAEGRMTGGGAQFDLGGETRVSRGFTIHCDITLSNNLEINWPGNKWHLDKPLTSALCIDDPAYSPGPPRAPFDTFIGEGVGKLNGVDGATVQFVFIDAGEPGKNDKASFLIRDKDGNVVLDVPLSNLTHGNIQAHYDQPHSGNGNK